jgi:hypothetical protein
MKTKVTFITFLAVAASFCGVAQSTGELDDMYFTSKDRATLNASRAVALTSESARRVTESETANVINPTDSYSARNVNPEYVAGSKVNGNSSSVASYFSPNYIPAGVNQSLVRTNCGTCGNSSFTNYNNSYFPYNNFGYGMNPYSSFSMMNPYYGFGNGFYQQGLSFGFGSFYGNGFGSPFFNNYYGMNPYYGYGYGYGSYYNSFYNPYMFGNGGYGYTNVIVVDRPRPQSSRNAEVNRYYSADGVRTTASTGGRVATSPTEYYNKTWRNDTQVARGSDTWNNTRSYQQNNTNWNNQNGWGTNNGFGGSDGSRSSFNTGGAGGRSGGGGVAPAPSSGGGGGSRRGRD